MQRKARPPGNKRFLSKEKKIITLLRFVSVIVGILWFISCQTATNKNLPIIDMHMHSYTVEYMGEANIPNPVIGRPSGMASDEELMLATLSEMRRYNQNLLIKCC